MCDLDREIGFFINVLKIHLLNVAGILILFLFCLRSGLWYPEVFSL